MVTGNAFSVVTGIKDLHIYVDESLSVQPQILCIRYYIILWEKYPIFRRIALGGQIYEAKLRYE